MREFLSSSSANCSSKQARGGMFYKASTVLCGFSSHLNVLYGFTSCFPVQNWNNILRRTQLGQFHIEATALLKSTDWRMNLVCMFWLMKQESNERCRLMDFNKWKIRGKSKHLLNNLCGHSSADLGFYEAHLNAAWSPCLSMQVKNSWYRQHEREAWS